MFSVECVRAAAEVSTTYTHLVVGHREGSHPSSREEGPCRVGEAAAAAAAATGKNTTSMDRGQRQHTV